MLLALVFPLSVLAEEVEIGDKSETFEDRLENGIAKLEIGDFNIALHSRVQVWGGWVGEDALLSNGDRMQEYGFRLRRARLGVEGEFIDWLTYKIELDLFDQEKNGSILYEAWIDFTPTPYFGVSVGLDNLPFAYTEIRSSAGFAHLDRTMGVMAMSPDNTLGLTLHTEPWPEHVRITAGIYNGLQRKANFFEGYEGVGVSLGNKFERLSFAARIDIEPMDKLGFEEADLDWAAPRLGFGGGVMYNHGNSIATLGATGHLHLKAYGFHLLGEAIWDWSWPQEKSTSLNTINEETQRLTVSASVGYYFKWINLGLAFRTEYINDNYDFPAWDETFASGYKTEGDLMTYAVTLSYYAVKNFVKVQVEYLRRCELEGRALKNDAAIASLQLYF